MPKVNIAPPRIGGDAIELFPLKGKLVGVLCKARDKKSTKFGVREMTQIALMTETSKEPLIGITFTSYFQTLPLNQWFIGVVEQSDAGGNKAWVLATDKIDAKAAKALAAILDKTNVDDAPTTSVLA